MTIIGLTGKAKAGKDEVAKILVQERGFTKFAFATRMKEIIGKCFDFTEDELNGHKTICSRKVLQGFGTNFVRNYIDKNYWINYLKNDLIDFVMENGSDGNIIITDIRFLNEAEYVKAIGGQLIRVIRQNNPEIEIGANHISETEMDDYTRIDGTILNDGTLEDLRAKVHQIL